MKTESIKELIALCRAGSCSIKLDGCATGIVATVTSNRGKLTLQTTEYLDVHDKEIAKKLEDAVKRVQ
jgi:hypothetical protein